DRRAEPARDRRRRTHLPREGRAHAPRAFRRDGAAARGLRCRPAEVGPRATPPLGALGTPSRGRGVEAILLGATRGSGRSLARLMAERGDAVALLGRDSDAVARSARELAVLGASHVATAECDLGAPEGFGPALDAVTAALGGVDTIVLTAADFA